MTTSFSVELSYLAHRIGQGSSSSMDIHDTSITSILRLSNIEQNTTAVLIIRFGHDPMSPIRSARRMVLPKALRFRREPTGLGKKQSIGQPFEPTLEPITLAKVRLEIAAREALETREIQHTVSPGGMIVQGIEIEDSQGRLPRETGALGPHSTDLQCAKVIELEADTRLRRKIEACTTFSMFKYMPAVALVRQREESNASSGIYVSRKLTRPWVKFGDSCLFVRVVLEQCHHCEALWASQDALQDALVASTKVIDKEKKKGGN
ncbi:hypothetical protein C8J56DRAFT_887071 [Mycena floridula]|nr:hypothetical protein C8J56DRAFT_887071 [Mycena floridula]